MNENFKVLILLSTYNGDRFLREQLESILSQTYKVDILVRDDSSSDSTVNILSGYEVKHGIKWYQGKNLGPQNSFLNLVINASLKYDYFAFADQDDIWDRDKIKNAIENLNNYNSNIPLLYCSSLNVVDSKMNHMFVRNFDIEGITSDLMQSFYYQSWPQGCTMVFNNSLASYLKLYQPKKFVSHDGWTHKLCLALAGSVVFDIRPQIFYRIHTNNVAGIKRAPLRKRIQRNIKKQCLFSETAKEILIGYEKELSSDAKKSLFLVSYYKNSFENKRHILFRKYNHKYGVIHVLKFWLKVIFNRY
jgi:rhamnosyltransferase